MSREFTLESIGPELERVARRLGSATRKAMVRSAHLARTRAVQEESIPVDTGQLKRSFVVTPIEGGAALENVAPHAPYMEFGTKPHTAPLSAIVAWAERKLRGTMRKGKKRTASAEAMGRAVWRAIQRRGTEGRGFYAAASQDFPEIVEREILRALKGVGK